MEINMKFDIIKIIELLQNYGYELDIIPAEKKPCKNKGSFRRML